MNNLPEKIKEFMQDPVKVDRAFAVAISVLSVARVIYRQLHQD